MPDKSTGLYSDFSDEAVSGRLLARSSGLPPHQWPGHKSPNQKPDLETTAERALKLTRSPPSEDIPQT